MTPKSSNTQTDDRNATEEMVPNNTCTNYTPENRQNRTNIPAAGDPLIERQHGDGFTRFGFQNIRGASIDNGLGIATEIDTMLMLGTDIQGLSINKQTMDTN